MSKMLIKYDEYFGRQGDLSAVFAISDVEYAENKLDGEGVGVYLGEALGKHSQVHATLSHKTCSVVSQDDEFIDKMMTVLTGDAEGHYIAGTDVWGTWLDQKAEQDSDLENDE